MADYTSSYTGEQIDAGIAKANTAMQPNTAITAATKCKVTYDSKGLVTAGSDLSASDIPSLDAGKITSGTFADGRIPSLDASKIGSGTLADARIASATTWNNKASVSDITTKINRSTNVNAADTNYTTLMARGESLVSADTTPAVNGAICWTYA